MKPLAAFIVPPPPMEMLPPAPLLFGVDNMLMLPVLAVIVPRLVTARLPPTAPEMLTDVPCITFPGLTLSTGVVNERTPVTEVPPFVVIAPVADKLKFLPA